MKRVNGYYWVFDGDEWIIAEWYNYLNTDRSEFWICGNDNTYHDSDFKEIDETPITRKNESSCTICKKDRDISNWPICKQCIIDMASVKSCKDPDVISGNKHCFICMHEGCNWFR